MASEAHEKSVKSATVTIDGVQERIEDDVDAAILRDARSILDDYLDGLEVDENDE